MSVEENKRLVRRYIEQGRNTASRAVILDVLAPDAVIHGPGPFDSTTEAEAAMTEVFRDFLLPPDVVVEMIAEGDLVVTRATATLHFVRASFDAANAEVGAELEQQHDDTETVIYFHRIEGGKIVEEWVI